MEGEAERAQAREDALQAAQPGVARVAEVRRRLTAPERVARRLEALTLRTRGLPFRVIAHKLAISEAAASKIVRQALARAEDVPAADLRRLEVERLDVMLDGLWERAADGRISAVETVLRLMDRRARLLGLDLGAPGQGVHGGAHVSITLEQLVLASLPTPGLPLPGPQAPPVLEAEARVLPARAAGGPIDVGGDPGGEAARALGGPHSPPTPTSGTPHPNPLEGSTLEGTPGEASDPAPASPGGTPIDAPPEGTPAAPPSPTPPSAGTGSVGPAPEGDAQGPQKSPESPGEE